MSATEIDPRIVATSTRTHFGTRESYALGPFEAVIRRGLRGYVAAVYWKKDETPANWRKIEPIGKPELAFFAPVTTPITNSTHTLIKTEVLLQLVETENLHTQGGRYQ